MAWLIHLCHWVHWKVQLNVITHQGLDMNGMTTFGHTKIRRHHGTHGTHGTDFIGCRRGKGGASTGTGAMRDRCHVTKLNELYRHPGAAVRLKCERGTRSKPPQSRQLSCNGPPMCEVLTGN